MNKLNTASFIAGLISATAFAFAAAATEDQTEVDVTITVVPFATLEFIGNPLLYLAVPPPGSTVPSNGVDFLVIGNASVSVSAEPNEFITIPGQGVLARARRPDGESVGYNIELRFPRLGVLGSPANIAALPNFTEGPAVSPVVDLTLTANEREGRLHMEASEMWTEAGGLALPGLYEGEIILTLAAE